MSMVTSSISMNDKIKGCLIQLKEKIAKLIQVMSQLVTLSTQVPSTLIAKLFPISKYQDLSSSKEDHSWKLSLSKAKRFIREGKQTFSYLQF